MARTAIFNYIESFYNRSRRYSSLGYLACVLTMRSFAMAFVLLAKRFGRLSHPFQTAFLSAG